MVRQSGHHRRIPNPPLETLPWLGGGPEAVVFPTEVVGANRQLIAKLLPTADRSVFVVSGRQLIASISGGCDCSSRRSGSRLLLTLRWLHPRVGVGDHAGNLENRRRITCCAA